MRQVTRKITVEIIVSSIVEDSDDLCTKDEVAKRVRKSIMKINPAEMVDVSIVGMEDSIEHLN